MKKLLALQGSPHPRGVTSRLLEAFLACAPDGGGNPMEIKTVHVFDEAISFCDGCGACAVTPGCKKSENAELFRFLEQSDALVVATPVYLLSFPAPLKAVFDRFQQYYSARFSLNIRPAIAKPKKAFLIVTQGSGSPEGARVIRRQCEVAFSVMNTRICGCLTVTNTDTAGEAELARAMEDAAHAASDYFALFD